MKVVIGKISEHMETLLDGLEQQLEGQSDGLSATSTRWPISPGRPSWRASISWVWTR